MIGWVIASSHPNPRPVYWSGVGYGPSIAWSIEITEAVQFVRERDAEHALKALGFKSRAKVVEALL
ncbi:MAG TPA: hypothetical protein VHQ39_08025 [Dongiaceae bacterium]|jgi:hypothetical protein|nr:hypothetical protein [Dongiaceae bacterium]